MATTPKDELRLLRVGIMLFYGSPATWARPLDIVKLARRDWRLGLASNAFALASPAPANLDNLLLSLPPSISGSTAVPAISQETTGTLSAFTLVHSSNIFASQSSRPEGCPATPPRRYSDRTLQLQSFQSFMGQSDPSDTSRMR